MTENIFLLGAVIGFFVLVTFLTSRVGAPAGGLEDPVEQPDALFRSGNFEAAAKAYQTVLSANADNYDAILRLGEIALLSNQLDEAERRLTKARSLRPDERRPKALLAETFYRRDDCRRAAPLFRDLGRDALADKLASFGEETPYQVIADTNAARIKFVLTDPLPLVQVRVNGGAAVYFLIDTGGAELILDPGLADKAGAVRFCGRETGTGAGEQRVVYEHARIDSLTLGAFEVRSVPVNLVDTSRFSVAAGGKRVDGIIGTVLLYHFISTMDYPNGELVLRRKTGRVLAHIETEAKSDKAMAVPFWMAGDHYMVAWGRVNRSDPRLLFLDTGLAGAGFTCPESTLKEAGIKPAGQSFDGIGGGGTVKVTPFVVEELLLGDAMQRNVMSFLGPFPSSLEYGYGFRIGGLISHAFFRPYAVTFDFSRMRLYLKSGKYDPRP